METITENFHSKQDQFEKNLPNPSYEYSKRSTKKIRSKRHAKRHESLCHLLSLLDRSSVDFEEDEIDQNVSILIKKDSPFFKLVSNQQNLKIWLDFISKSGDSQDDFINKYDNQKNSEMSKTDLNKLDKNPFKNANRCFRRIDKNLQHIYSKEYSLICLKKFEEEILPFFLCSTFPNHFILEIECPFERMVLHSLCQYLNIKSKSFEGTDGKKSVLLKCDNDNLKFQKPPILLSEYIQKTFY